MSSKIRITLQKSLIGRKKKHIEIANLLGLRKIRSCVEHNNNAAILGMINQINYLVKVEECE